MSCLTESQIRSIFKELDKENKRYLDAHDIQRLICEYNLSVMNGSCSLSDEDLFLYCKELCCTINGSDTPRIRENKFEEAVELNNHVFIRVLAEKVGKSTLEQLEKKYGEKYSESEPDDDIENRDPNIPSHIHPKISHDLTAKPIHKVSLCESDLSESDQLNRFRGLSTDSLPVFLSNDSSFMDSSFNDSKMSTESSCLMKKKLISALEKNRDGHGKSGEDSRVSDDQTEGAHKEILGKKQSYLELQEVAITPMGDDGQATPKADSPAKGEKLYVSFVKRLLLCKCFSVS
eukprot:CAMPEP_0115000688 /NCGR_PEP_ID=MMETSP0216-20121206/16910_1 /TAXON_ID=223996 /ORGANISM="Protocruzia adherens, Strain Boccale" /LENGTH=289 /DNA_ID=CAMNT_0002365841 /DNA_START=43 /DNA_END=912 /DNA_ORIENTATION=-